MYVEYVIYDEENGRSYFAYVFLPAVMPFKLPSESTWAVPLWEHFEEISK